MLHLAEVILNPDRTPLWQSKEKNRPKPFLQVATQLSMLWEDAKEEWG
jgi:hypothetical protein